MHRAILTHPTKEVVANPGAGPGSGKLPGQMMVLSGGATGTGQGWYTNTASNRNVCVDTLAHLLSLPPLTDSSVLAEFATGSLCQRDPTAVRSLKKRSRRALLTGASASSKEATVFLGLLRLPPCQVNRFPSRRSFHRRLRRLDRSDGDKGCPSVAAVIMPCGQDQSTV